MFELFMPHSEDAISILKADHQKVEDLFERFENTKGLKEKKIIVAETIMELKIHAAIEEEIFYPAIRKSLGKKIMTEADEEHHVAKFLIAELEGMTGKEDHYDAKFTVLAENIRHHIKEEEGEMFTKAEALSTNMAALGIKMLARKNKLMRTGVATFAEERMVAKSKGHTDSPAQAARRKPPAHRSGSTHIA